MKQFFLIALMLLGGIQLSNVAQAAETAAAADVLDNPPFHARVRFKLPMYPIALERYLPPGQTATGLPFKPKDDLDTFDFNIKLIGDDGNERTVGVLYLQYYKKADTRYYTIEGPMLRISNFSIGDVACPSSLSILDKNPLQKQGYGSMAMETLFKALRESPDFSNIWPIFLEAPTYVKHLVPWYEKFGFTSQYTPPEAAAGMVQYMAVSVGKTKFPYYKKHKPAKAGTKEP